MTTLLLRRDLCAYLLEEVFPNATDETSKPQDRLKPHCSHGSLHWRRKVLRLDFDLKLKFENCSISFSWCEPVRVKVDLRNDLLFLCFLCQLYGSNRNLLIWRENKTLSASDYICRRHHLLINNLWSGNAHQVVYHYMTRQWYTYASRGITVSCRHFELPTKTHPRFWSLL